MRGVDVVLVRQPGDEQLGGDSSLLALGLPDRRQALGLGGGVAEQHPVHQGVVRMIGAEELLALQAEADAVYVDPSLIEYAVRLVGATRQLKEVGLGDLQHYISFGASPRASIALAKAARASALLQGRGHVIPEDVRHLVHRVLRHRVLLSYEATADDVRVETIIDAVVRGVRTP